MNKRDDNDARELEAEQVESLRQAFRITPLDAQALDRIRGSAHRAWLETVNRRGRTRRRVLALAASIAAIAVTVTVLGVLEVPPGPAPITAHVVRIEGNSLLHSASRTAALPIAVGATLRVGDSVATSAAAGLAIELAGGISLRVRADSALRFAGTSVVELERGVVYLDLPAHAQSSISVRTPGIRVDHLGTQFSVALAAGATSVNVREGSVRVRSDAADEQLVAGERLTISAAGELHRERIAVAGSEWAWAEALAPDFDVENKSLAAFLEWFERETGRRLVYATPDAHARAQSAKLHGSIERLSPDSALAAVFATTTLSYELTGDQIKVSSSPAHDPASPGGD